MTSLWLDRSPAIETDVLGRRDFDEIVVGAGLTGLTTALLLARAGRRVAVLEARDVGAVATGNTTAKLSLLQGSHLQKIRSKNTEAVLQAYVAANLAGQRWMLDFAATHAVPVQRRTAYSYATTPEGARTVEAEFTAASAAGLPVTLEPDAGLPFPTTAAVALADQAEFDPMHVLAALAREFRSLGGVLHTGVRLVGAKAIHPVAVHTTVGAFRAERLVLATGTPVLDRGLYFAKLRALRSYAASYRVAAGTALPSEMYLSVDSPSRSIRTTPDGEGGELLVVGGNGHVVGRDPSPAALVENLHEWTLTHWAGAERTNWWSAQDYETPHGVPFVGWLPRGRGRIFVATGYDKWGMTNAAQCALTLAADLLGGEPEWARTLHHRPTLPAAIATGIGMNAAQLKYYAVGWAGALSRRLPDAAPAEGAGVVGRAGVAPTAESTVEGLTCRVSAICSHQHAILGWNDAEKSWDCPAHGSRFAPDGAVLEGPAKEGLGTRTQRNPSRAAQQQPAAAGR
ncbi:FAD-dependent oxidoreductase [Rathayibacter sp. YIM 133350]|uniref:FAD-dependent oxidoreductase n=1 Tax=Rathayibacter sp. YIM 133350 TaxID=3131992 RepID=UPI00307CD956